MVTQVWNFHASCALKKQKHSLSRDLVGWPAGSARVLGPPWSLQYVKTGLSHDLHLFPEVSGLTRKMVLQTVCLFWPWQRITPERVDIAEHIGTSTEAETSPKLIAMKPSLESPLLNWGLVTESMPTCEFKYFDLVNVSRKLDIIVVYWGTMLSERGVGI